MILFHTTDRIIKEPDLGVGRKNADFGQGFYLTPDEAFAWNWARERTDSEIFVNRYELDPDGLNVKVLERNAEWFEFIYNNRRGTVPNSHDGEHSISHDGTSQDMQEYDVIIGPIANDTLFETYGIITSGLLSTDQALELLKIGPEFMQAGVRTAKGREHLSWVSAYTLTEEMIRAARENYEKQSESFEIDFAEKLDKIDIDA